MKKSALIYLVASLVFAGSPLASFASDDNEGNYGGGSPQLQAQGQFQLQGQLQGQKQSLNNTNSATGGSVTLQNGAISATNTSTNTNTNTSTNSNSNSIQAGAVQNSNSVSASSYAGGNGSNNNVNNYSALLYPNWVNVNPSQSSVSADSVTCQGPTLNGAVSALNTQSWNNQYGVQGTLGFSVPLSGQGDCRAISAQIRKRSVVENTVRTLIACRQLELSGLKYDVQKFPELAACSASPVASK